MAYRSSAGDVRYYDDEPRRPQRWDRERFESMRSRGPPEERIRIQDRHESGSRSPRGGGGGGERDLDIEIDIDRRRSAPRAPVMERERERDFDDRYRRRNFEFPEEPTPAEIANQALAPYRRKSIVDRDIDLSIRRPSRPQFLRRQSSLDTFDRRPRYDDRDEWRPPKDIPIPLPIRERERRRSPPRGHYEEFEEIRYRDVEPAYREEIEYRDVKISKERGESRSGKSKSGRSKAPSSVAPSGRSSSTSSFETVEPAKPAGKKGRTRLPKRLAHRNAVVQLGYPFDEEEDFIVVKRALEKEQIDEVIKISENYKDETRFEKKIYKYEEPIEGPPGSMPPEDFHSEHHPPPPPESVHSHHTTLPPGPPPPPSSYHPPPPPSFHPPAHSVRSASPPRETIIEERYEHDSHVGGPLTVVVPRGVHRSDEEIRREIAQLERERKALILERDVRETDYDFELVERRESREKERDIVRVEKDRKDFIVARPRSRSRSRRRRKPDPKAVAIAMGTLM